MRPQGYLCISDPEAGNFESDTYTCRHCQRIVWRRGDGGFCRTCDSMICNKCVGKDCVPFMKKIEEMEERYYRYRQSEL
jgi:hypothetical protein